MENELEYRDCPICGSPMERGYLLSSSGIYWNTKMQKGISVWKCQGESLSTTSNFDFWRGSSCAYLVALRCKSCKIIQYR